MSPELLAVLAIMSFLILVLLEVPVALSLLIAGTMGTALLRSPGVAANALAATPYATTAKYALFIIPMYVVLGALISNAGIGEKIYRATSRLVRRLPGGLAATCVIATSIFSGISGSSAADVATFGRLSVTEMRRNGYDAAYAAAVVAAAGTFAVLIPPSIVLVIYGIMSGESIGAMILAGVVPGAISAGCLVTFVVVKGFIDRSGEATTAPAEAIRAAPAAAPPTPGATPRPSAADGGSAAAQPPSTSGDLIGLLYAAILFVIVVGGLYGGIFTGTEAGAVGAFAALVIAIIARRSSDKSLPQLLIASAREAIEVTSMIFMLLIGGAVFTFFIVSAGLPITVTEWILGLPVDPNIVLALFLLAIIPLGMFLDGLSILLFTVPIMAPVVVQSGFDGVWFGVLVVKTIEMGLITPPVGINVFIISGLVPDLRVEHVFRRVGPFVALDLAVTALFFLVPGIVTWLPRAAGL